MTKKAIALFAVGLLLAACSSETATPPATQRTGEPKTAAGLEVAAGTEFNSFAAGNYGAVWDRLDEASKKLVTRADYIAAVSDCPNPFDGVPISVERVTPNPDGTWNVELKVGGQLLTMPAAYEDGRWVFPFTTQARAKFASGDLSC